MEQHIRQALLAAAPDLFGAEINDTSIQFQQTRRDMEGPHIGCFSFRQNVALFSSRSRRQTQAMD
jgi:hypothetical protein